MISTHEDQFFAPLRCGLALYIIFGGMIALMHPKLLIWPYFAIISWASYRFIRCCYVSESITEYISYSLWYTLNIGILLTYLASFAETRYHLNIATNQAALLSLLPVGIIYTFYLISSYRKTFNSPFIAYNKNITTSNASKPISSRNTLKFAFTCAGVASLAGITLKNSDWTMAILSLFFLSISLHLIHYHRNTISGLRKLKLEETKANFLYSFNNIESIRHLRNSTHVGRAIRVLQNHLKLRAEKNEK
jgi:hypothetical protein